MAKKKSKRAVGRDGGAAGASAAMTDDGRNFGVIGMIFGVGGLALSWLLVGGALGAIGIVLGAIAMAKAIGAKGSVEAAGARATVSGSFGLGLVAIVTGIAAIAVSVVLHLSEQEAISKCEHLDKSSPEYAKCISKEMGTDQPKQR